MKVLKLLGGHIVGMVCTLFVIGVPYVVGKAVGGPMVGGVFSVVAFSAYVVAGIPSARRHLKEARSWLSMGLVAALAFSLSPVPAGATGGGGSEGLGAGPSWAELSPGPVLSLVSLKKSRVAMPSGGAAFCAFFSSVAQQESCSTGTFFLALATCRLCRVAAATCIASVAARGINELVCSGALVACAACANYIPCITETVARWAERIVSWIEEQLARVRGPGACTDSSCHPDAGEPH